LFPILFPVDLERLQLPLRCSCFIVSVSSVFARMDPSSKHN